MILFKINQNVQLLVHEIWQKPTFYMLILSKIDNITDGLSIYKHLTKCLKTAIFAPFRNETNTMVFPKCRPKPSLRK